MIREFYQQKLEEIQDIEITPIMSDDIIEDGKTYFSFYLTETNISEDLDYNGTNQVGIIGFLKRKEQSNENTLQIIDQAKNSLKSKFKEVCTSMNYQDMPTVDGIVKVRITGNSKYNDLVKRIGG